jgi:hypothetical protein
VQSRNSKSVGWSGSHGGGRSFFPCKELFEMKYGETIFEIFSFG